MGYDRDNVFARILRGEIPCDKVYEDDHVLAFRDISPQAPVHVLIVPKGEYRDLDDFAAKAPDARIAAWVKAASTVAGELGIREDGYRVLTNVGSHGGQEVPHLHMHLFAGTPLGRMVKKGLAEAD